MAQAPFEEDDYIPRSPNLSAVKIDTHYEAPLHPQHQYRGSVSHISPFSPTGGPTDYFGRPLGPPLSTPTTPWANNNTVYGQQPQPQFSNMVKHEHDDEEYGVRKTRGRGKRAKRIVEEEVEEEEDEYYEEVEAKQEEEETTADNGYAGGLEVRTKFPTARIKRIMQADEDVGKVAQVTPVVVCTFASRPELCTGPYC
jgi:hypothetical protein